MVGTTAWWSLTFLLLHTCPEQTAAGGSVPQMPTQHSASAFTPPSISSVR